MITESMIVTEAISLHAARRFDNLIGANCQQIISLWGDSQIEFEGHQGSILRDVCFRNKVAGTTKDIVLLGSNIRVDNVRLQGCRLVLNGLQNSQITGLLVTGSMVEGVVVLENSANCWIQGTLKRNAGYGLVIDGPEIRSIYVHGMPIEENTLGQVQVKSSSKYGRLVFTGRLNSVEDNGPPLTVPRGANRVVWSDVEIRNKSGKPDMVIV